MSKINSEKISLGDLFETKYWFQIPAYQRPYVWKEDNINELLDDLLYAFNNRSEDEYFLGALVLQKIKEIDYDVLDGQQRLTTLCILISVMRDYMINENVSKELQSMIYKEKNELRKIKAKSRLTFKIRGNVQEFFNEYIIQKRGTLKIEKASNSNVSIKNMKKAVSITREWLEENFGNKIQRLKEFAMFLNTKIMLIYVCTENREDAFRLFTILNNRGIPLTTADILKSLNLERIKDIKEREEKAKYWEELEEAYKDKFDRFLNFIRTIILKEKARKNLLDEFEEKIYKKNLLKKGRPTIKLLEEMDKIYDLLINLNDSENKLSNEFKNLITIMKTGFNSEDWIPPLLYYYSKFKNHRLEEFLKKLDNKFMGDLVNKGTPTFRLESMNKILKIIEKANNYIEVIQDKEVFKFNNSLFAEKINSDIYGERFCKYLLLKYEYLVKDNESVHFDNYKNISVEHILPKNPKIDGEWSKLFTEEERTEYTNKIGNLSLLNRRKNSKLGNLDFKEKKEKYFKGNSDVFKSSNIYLSLDIWDINNLKKRQEEMVNKLLLNNQ